MADDPQADLQQLQMIEQSAHAITTQRTSYQQQLLEIENASRELSTTKESYRIIGNIMVKTESDRLKNELEEKKGVLQSRVASLEKQEKKLRDTMQQMQEKILKGNNGKV